MYPRRHVSDIDVFDAHYIACVHENCSDAQTPKLRKKIFLLSLLQTEFSEKIQKMGTSGQVNNGFFRPPEIELANIFLQRSQTHV